MWFLIGIVSSTTCTSDDRLLWAERNVEVTGIASYSDACALCIVETHYCCRDCADGSEKDIDSCLRDRCEPVFAKCMGEKSFDYKFWAATQETAVPLERYSGLPMSDGPALPVVVMHGLEDSSKSAFMKSLCYSIPSAYPGTYVTCIPIANGYASLTTRMDQQLEAFRTAILSDEKLKNGFNAIGISQGNLIIRAYIERYNDPPVFTYISVVGPHNGVASCPDNVFLRLICPLWERMPYDAPFSFSDYWKEAIDKETYLAKSRFLADINNERESKTEKYADNMKRLKNYVLVESLNDTVVKPHVTEQHGFLKWGEEYGGKLESLEETEGYKGDWIGLRTLAESNRLHKLHFDANHVSWSAKFWRKLLVFLKPDETASKHITAALLDETSIERVVPLAKTVGLLGGQAARPTVFMHGMGDSGSNPGMQSICQSVSEAYPGTYVNCLDVANGAESISMVLDKQLADFVTAIRQDKKLAHGFNAVGMSQGNLLIRAYIERYNDPPVHTFISMVGPHGGIADCPDNWLYKMVCPMWSKSPYWEPVVFSDYWKNPLDKAEYLKKSRFLADINNEREKKNATYIANMKKLEKYVLVEALGDTMVEPHVSEQHGFVKWGSSEKTDTEQLEETEGYKGDWLGLKTLKESGRLHKLTYNGDHMRWSDEFWTDTILPFLKPDSGAGLLTGVDAYEMGEEMNHGKEMAMIV